MNDASEPSGNGGGPGSCSATSRSWLQRVQAGDAEAWDRLVALYAPLVFHWCKAGALQTADTADILQEVFLAVATHVTTFRKENKHNTFRGWLHTITRNKINDHFRRLGREPRGEGGTDAGIRLAAFPARPLPEDEGAVEESIEQSLFHCALALIRDEFEERTWQAFWKTAVEGRSPKDVAVELSTTPGAVRVAKSRVLQRLRRELGDLEA